MPKTGPRAAKPLVIITLPRRKTYSSSAVWHSPSPPAAQIITHATLTRRAGAYASASSGASPPLAVSLEAGWPVALRNFFSWACHSFWSFLTADFVSSTPWASWVGIPWARAGGAGDGPPCTTEGSGYPKA